MPNLPALPQDYGARGNVKAIVLLTDGEDHRSDPEAAAQAAKAAGAKILLYAPGMNHAKLILVDRAIGLFGSANLDMRSLFVNFEIGAAVHDPSFAANRTTRTRRTGSSR